MKRERNQNITIALLAEPFILWAGGVDLLSNIARALQQNSDLTVKLFVPESGHEPLFEIHSYRSLYKHRVKNILRPVKHIFWKPEPVPVTAPEMIPGDVLGALPRVNFANTYAGFTQALKRESVDVVMPSASSLGRRFPWPWIGYIWDFQHRQLPELFSAEEIRGRNILFEKIAMSAPVVMVNSRAVRQDIETFYPGHKSAVVSLPFSPLPKKEWLEMKDESLRDRYNLPQQYFMVANQFWMHKDHGTAFEAIARMHRDGNSEVHLVCTGKMEEPRDPEYIERLREQVGRLGAESYIHLLGFIPKADQIAIMKQAIAVVQPTLCEGGPGGGAAYDALALGVPCIVSDIAINQEISSERVRLFAAGKPDDLARQMKIMLREPMKPVPERELIAEGEMRMKALATTLRQAIATAMGRA